MHGLHAEMLQHLGHQTTARTVRLVLHHFPSFRPCQATRVSPLHRCSRILSACTSEVSLLSSWQLSQWASSIHSSLSLPARPSTQSFFTTGLILGTSVFPLRFGNPHRPALRPLLHPQFPPVNCQHHWNMIPGSHPGFVQVPRRRLKITRPHNAIDVFLSDTGSLNVAISRIISIHPSSCHSAMKILQ